MRYTLFGGIFTLALCLGLTPPASAQPADTWSTPVGVWQIPPNPSQIDALNFINPLGAIFFAEDLALDSPFTTFETTNFLNQGNILVIPGMEFKTFPVNIGLARPANSFANIGDGASGGVLQCSSVFQLIAAGGSRPFSTGRILVSANQITNSGTITGDPFSLVQMVGKNLDLTHGIIDLTQGGLNVAGTNVLLTGVASGWLDGYWGLATGPTNTMVPVALNGNGFAVTPGNPIQITVTNRNFLTGIAPVVELNPATYATSFPVGNSGSNFLTQVLFFSEPNPSFTTSVFFNQLFGIFVQWQWSSTNSSTGDVNPNNFLLLNDNFGEVTNLEVVVDGVAGPNTTYKPFNYTFSFPTVSFGGSPFPPGSVALPGFLVTNSSTSYQAIFSPVAQLPTDVLFSDVTNLPGRIELNASDTLSLSNALINSPNYLLLKTTNHFRGSPEAQISTPNADLLLRTTNGIFSVTNLLAPYVNHVSGPVELWSARWTNIFGGITNSFHILFVNSSLNTVTIPQIQTLSLIVTNIGVSNSLGDLVISDILNVTRNLNLNARSITITTNDSVIVPSGQLNLLSPDVSWPASTPGLRALTNWGIITAANAVFFGGSRSSPIVNPGDTNLPYDAFVNHGQIIDLGSSVFARHFENSGLLEADIGSILLQQAFAASLTNGTVLAMLGGISLASDNLLISNTLFQADGSIALAATNILEDGVQNIAVIVAQEMGARLASEPALSGLFGTTNLAALTPAQRAQLDAFSTNLLTATVTNGNTWAGAGLSLTTRPTFGDLLGTTITSVAPLNQLIPIVWAAEDRPVTNVYTSTNSGFLNNAAVGRLILDGQVGSRFVFQHAPGFAHNAMYVDSLEFLDDTATNLMNYPTSTLRVVVQQNMKVYYAQALANGVSIAEKLNGQSGGRFIWVSNYNYGYFSSTNLLYGDGSTNRVNAALAASCHIISNPDANYNCNNPLRPIYPVENWPLPAGTNNVFPLPPAPDPLAGPANVPALARGVPKLDPPPMAASDSSNTVAGAYYGLFSDSSNGVSVASSGCLSINVTPRSNYTAKLFLGGRAYSSSGSLGSGSAVRTFELKAGGSLKLQLQQAGSEQIHGTLSSASGHWSADLLANRAVFSRNARRAAAAAYTMRLSPDTNSTPSGTGFGTVKIDAGGKVQWSGILADGSRVTQSTGLSPDGFWPLYSSLYGGKGLVLGWMQVTNQTQPPSDLNGSLVWVKPGGVTVKSWPRNLTNGLDAVGSVYQPQPGGSPLDLDKGTLLLTGGPLGTNASPTAFTLDGHGRTSAGANKLKLTLKPSGLFNGSVVDAALGKVSFQGVVLQDTTNGSGFFLNSNQSGTVELSPGP